MSKNNTSLLSLQDLDRESVVKANIKQEYIVTTDDKLRLVLIEWENNKKSTEMWWTYLAMMLSFLFPCFTAEFKPFMSISAETLEAVSLGLSLFFLVLTFVSVYKIIKNRNKFSIDYCIERITNDKNSFENSKKMHDSLIDDKNMKS